MTEGVEFYSLPHVVALGRRKMILAPKVSQPRGASNWEVYVRLVSGSTFTLADGLTYAKAGKLFREKVRDMSEQGGSAFVTTPNACVPFEHVARIFVDTEGNEFITILEDSSSAQYEIERGGQERCVSAVEKVAGVLLQYMQQKGAA